MKKELSYTIYALVDPRDNVIRYIGITYNPDARLKEHLQGRGGNSPKRKWIEELRQIGLAPIMQPLETGLSLPDALERESYLIQHYLNVGYELVNLRVNPYLHHLTRKNNPSYKVTGGRTSQVPARLTQKRKVTVKLSDLITEAGFRKTEIARETGLSVHTIVHICNGQPTTKSTMSRILKVIEGRLKRSITLDTIEGINITD